MEAAGSVFPELAAGRTVFVLRLDPEKSPAGSPVSLYVREEASRTPLEPWEKARWWWSESKERSKSTNVARVKKVARLRTNRGCRSRQRSCTIALKSKLLLELHDCAQVENVARVARLR